MKKRIGFKIVGVLIFVPLAVAGLSALVMYLWNYALVPGVGFGEINFWQAMAILVLSKILFTGIRPRRRGHHGPPWRKKWKGMSDEEREAMKDKWKQYCETRKEEKRKAREDS